MKNPLQLSLLVSLFILSNMGIKAQGIFFNDCSDQTFCYPLGQCGNTTLTLTMPATTSCGNSNITLNYKIDFGNNGSIDLQANADTINESFPPGQSKITWRATTGCGQANTCTQIITVRDCQAPNLICRNGVTQSLDNNCSLTINAMQFVLSVSDNCTPTGDLEFGLRRAGTGTGFPPYDTINYHTCDQGTNIVEMFVRDGNGNINQCANYVLVQDNSNQCPCVQNSNIQLSGCARTSMDTKLVSYRINAAFAGTANGSPVTKQLTQNFTDSCFSVALETLPLNVSGTATLRASRNDMVTTGVTPYDLILISRHILNLEPFTSFYQTLAADVNRTGTITTFDIVEIRKALLGTVDTLPAVGAWQFIQPVPDPSNLVAFGFLKDTIQRQVTNLEGDIAFGGFNWIGIKSGDIDRTASLTGSLDERWGRSLLFTAASDAVTPGSVVEIPVKAGENVDLNAWQMNIQPLNGSEIVGVEGIDPSAYSIRPYGEVRFVWMDENIGASQHFQEGEVLFTLKIRAGNAFRTDDLFEVVPGEAVEAPIERRPLELRFAGDTYAQTFVTQPFPNPFSDRLEWGITAANEGPATVVLVDAAGRVIALKNTILTAGYQTISLDQLSSLPAGWYSWRIAFEGSVATGKLFKKSE